MSVYSIMPWLLLLAVMMSAVMFFALRAVSSEKLIYEKESQYHHIMVYEEGSVRTLRLGDGPDAGKQSRIDTRHPELHLLEYTRLIFAGLLVNPEPSKILVIGIGGGVIPMTFRRHFPDCEIDVVDIDPYVVEAAEKYFFFSPDAKTRTHISDGRLFVVQQIDRNPEKKYDMVILDAYNMDSIPRHMVTREFLMQIRAVLDPEGVVVANILSYTRLFHSEIKTYRKVFKACYVFMGRQARNAILVAPGTQASGLDSDSVKRGAELLQQKHRFSFSMPTVAQQFRQGYSPGRGAKVLTDEKLLNS